MAKLPTHTSMRGVQVNMEEMRAKNEQSVAVTGRGAQLRMNARGDMLTAGGHVNKRREDIEAEYNQHKLQGNVKRVDVRAVEPDTFETPQQVVERLKALKAAQAQAPAAKPETSSAPLADVFEAAEKPANKDRVRKISEKDD